MRAEDRRRRLLLVLSSKVLSASTSSLARVSTHTTLSAGLPPGTNPLPPLGGCSATPEGPVPSVGPAKTLRRVQAANEEKVIYQLRSVSEHCKVNIQSCSRAMLIFQVRQRTPGETCPIYTWPAWARQPINMHDIWPRTGRRNRAPQKLTGPLRGP